MSFKGELKPFQEEALEFTLQAGTAMLEYDMGLGKTVCAIAWAEELLDADDVTGGVVVVPDSLKYQWMHQIRAFTTGARVTVIDGEGVEGRAGQLRRAARAEYVILSYDNLLQDDVWAALHDHIDWDFVIADEVTAIKNFRAARSKRLKKLSPEFRLGLTGTPLENRLEETYSIMEWIDPKVFGRFDYFDKTFIERNTFGGVKGYKQIPLFNKLINQVAIRKTRNDPDVAPYMPRVVETAPRYVRLSRPARALYGHIVSDLLNELDKPGFSSFDLASHYGQSDNVSTAELARRGRIMSKMVCLRMLCDHPQLLLQSADLHDETHDSDWEGMAAGSKYAAQLKEEGLLAGAATWSSPKLDVLIGMIKEHLELDPESKVVVFSFFRSMLSQIEYRLEAERIQSVQFNGGMNPKQKDAAKIKFQTDPNVKVFISSDAGGYGVDLPQADLLISYDLPWSAGAWDQRNSRIIRLSSQFDEVVIASVLAEGSIEEYQYGVLLDKRMLASAFIDGKGFNKKDGTLSMGSDSLTAFLNDASI